MKIKHTFLFLFFYISSLSFACDCPAHPTANDAYFQQFDLIFKARVISVSSCNEISSAHVKLSELYRGTCTEEIDVYFDCSTDCMMSFAKGEEWIFYAKFFQHGKPRVEFCSRSRKYIANENKVQTEFVTGDMTFEEESELLRQQLGLHHFIKVNDQAELMHQNTKPGGTLTIILVLSSIVVLILFYYFFNKFFK